MKCPVNSYLHRKCRVSNFLSQLFLSACVNSSYVWLRCTALLGLLVSLSSQCFEFPYSVSVAPPSVRHTCKEAVCGSVMTHLLHTSLLPGHIWADRKSFFFCACLVERSRHCRNITSHPFLLSLFFCTLFQKKDI